MSTGMITRVTGPLLEAVGLVVEVMLKVEAIRAISKQVQLSYRLRVR